MLTKSPCPHKGTEFVKTGTYVFDHIETLHEVCSVGHLSFDTTILAQVLFFDAKFFGLFLELLFSVKQVLNGMIKLGI